MTWKAYFNDDSVLNQFENDKEIQFGEVLDRLHDLRALAISLPGRHYEVSFVDCSFNINGVQIHILDPTIYPPEQLKNIRPIYFKRRSANLNVTPGTGIGEVRTEFTAIGFQANFDGRNIKRFLAVFEDGHIEVREKK